MLPSDYKKEKTQNSKSIKEQMPRELRNMIYEYVGKDPAEMSEKELRQELKRYDVYYHNFNILQDTPQETKINMNNLRRYVKFLREVEPILVPPRHGFRVFVEELAEEREKEKGWIILTDDAIEALQGIYNYFDYQIRRLTANFYGNPEEGLIPITVEETPLFELIFDMLSEYTEYLAMRGYDPPPPMNKYFIYLALNDAKDLWPKEYLPGAITITNELFNLAKSS